MGYGDYTPQGGNHSKKPLTKKQIQKLQQAYAKADTISQNVKSLEEAEQKEVQKDIEQELKLVF